MLTQFDRTPGLAVRDFWNLDERSVLLVADQRGGNLLNFNVGEAFYAFMPRTFWVELQTRYGNQFYVRDHGEDRAIFDSLHSIEGCLAKAGAVWCQDSLKSNGSSHSSPLFWAAWSVVLQLTPVSRAKSLLGMGSDLFAALGHSVHCLRHWAGDHADFRLATAIPQRRWFLGRGFRAYLIYQFRGANSSTPAQ